MSKGELWAITTYFNPAGYKSKRENYLIFRECSKKQGLKLLCVELEAEGENFELSEEDADILVQTRAKDVLWQKERMLNIGLDNLPDTCTKVAWLDCDVIFENDNWVQETDELLDKYCIVQPFEWTYKLRKNEKWPVDITDKSIGKNNGQKLESFASVVAHRGFSPKIYCGHKGFAWAGRRSVFDKIGFYDAAILGEGDSIMSHAFLGVDVPGYTELLPKRCREHQQRWAKKAYKLVDSSLYYTKGIVYHLCHGDMKNRIYHQKSRQYNLSEFDPRTDIRIDPVNETWEWNSDKVELHKFLKEYFYIRKEDGA